MVFVHAHPDDETIFTGGTIRLLTERGHRVCVVVATDGSCGADDPRPGTSHRLARRRADELRTALARLGCEDVVGLDCRDSGMRGASDNHHPEAFVRADPDEVADRLAAVCRQRAADVLVGYDPGGIYGHPDHRMVHEVTRLAHARLPGVTLYEATVDREHLHFVDTHLVELAALGGPLPFEDLVGSVTAEIATVIDVRECIGDKREAMLAHVSQIDPAALPGTAAFAGVYGWEWYLRVGGPALLDDLAGHPA